MSWSESTGYHYVSLGTVQGSARHERRGTSTNGHFFQEQHRQHQTNKQVENQMREEVGPQRSRSRNIFVHHGNCNGGSWATLENEPIPRMRDGQRAEKGVTPSVSYASTPPTPSTKLALSQKRQNMMQRRIEMRRRSEERKRQQQQQQLHQQQDSTLQETQRRPQHLPQNTYSSLSDPYVQSHPLPYATTAFDLDDSNPKRENRGTRGQDVAQPENFRQSNSYHDSRLSKIPYSKTKHSSIDTFNHYQEQGRIRAVQNQHNPKYNLVTPSEKQIPTHRWQRHQPDQQYLHNMGETTRPIQHHQYSRSQSSPNLPSPPTLHRRQHPNQPNDNGFEESPSSHLLFDYKNHPYNEACSEQFIGENGPDCYDFEHGVVQDSYGHMKHTPCLLNFSRVVSPHEFPSDERHYRGRETSGKCDNRETVKGAHNSYSSRGHYDKKVLPHNYFEGEMANEMQESLQIQHHSKQRPERPERQQQNADSSHDLYPLTDAKSNTASNIQQSYQQQPDWQDISRHHFYQRQRAFLLQHQKKNHRGDSSAENVKDQKQQITSSKSNNNRTLSQRQPHPSNFSPIETLCNRTDQIQRKNKLLMIPVNGADSQTVADKTSSHQNQIQTKNQTHFDDGIGEGEESVVSVLDRVRNYTLRHDTEQRSRSLSCERPSRVPWRDSENHSYQEREPGFVSLEKDQGMNNINRTDNTQKFDKNEVRLNHSLHNEANQLGATEASPSSDYPSLLDEETVSGSVASLKLEWEGKFNPEHRRQRFVPQSQHPPSQSNERNAFGVWEERANRITALRRRERRREQRRSVEEKWRRSAVKSLPPEPRSHRKIHGQNPQFKTHPDGYNSENNVGNSTSNTSVSNNGHHHHEPPITVEDARRRLWDHNERLRAILPNAQSFESSGDIRHGWTDNVNSPGNTSGSAGSGMFKSKFIHAAALAAGHRSSVHGENTWKPVSKFKQSPPKGVAVLSHNTDSTAETTAITTPQESYGSTHHTQTSISRLHQNSHRRNRVNVLASSGSRMRTVPSPSSVNKNKAMIDCNVRNDEVECVLDSNHNFHQSQLSPVNAMNSRASVSDLIARINAVSRSNPAEALAAIDSIIKAEGNSGTPLQAAGQKRHGSAEKNLDHNSARRPLGKDFFQDQYETADPDTRKDRNECEEHSVYSSDDSTVSSMTNPTYQSVSEATRKKETPADRFAARHLRPVDKRAPANTFVSTISKKETDPRYYSQGKDIQTISENPGANDFGQQKSQPNSDRSNQVNDTNVPDTPTSNSTNDVGIDSFAPSKRRLKKTVEGIQYEISISHSDSLSKTGEAPKVTPRGPNLHHPLIHTNHHSQRESQGKSTDIEDADIFDSAWVSIPKNDYFNETRSKFEKLENEMTKQNRNNRNPVTNRLADEKTNGTTMEQPKLKIASSVTGSNKHSPDPVYTSALPHAISEAFSNVDISFEDEIAAKGEKYDQPVLSNAFSNVNVIFDRATPTSKRMGDIEQDISYISDDFGTSGHKNNVDGRNTNNGSNSHASTIKKRVEPNMQVKGNSKLAQKFASLVKAYESDKD